MDFKAAIKGNAGRYVPKCLDAIENGVLALTKKIESFSNRLETVENDLAALKLSNQETGQDKRKLREQFSTLEQQIEKLDRENRATNIIIEGLNLDKGTVKRYWSQCRTPLR